MVQRVSKKGRWCALATRGGHDLPTDGDERAHDPLNIAFASTQRTPYSSTTTSSPFSPMPPLRIKRNPLPGEVGSKEHARKWGLPKDVQPPFATFSRDPSQYLRVRTDRIGRSIKHQYTSEKLKEMYRETEKDLYEQSDPAPRGARHPALRLKDLEIFRTIGHGQEGAVYLVKIKEGKGLSNEFSKQDMIDNRRRMGTVFAMKALPKQMLRHYEFAKYEQHLADKDNELCKLTTMDWNPFVAGLIQTFNDERNIYLLLEHIPSGTLRDIMNKTPILSLESATFYFMNIICGLEHLYSHGIVHRDIKPENILIGQDGYLVLTDFGSSAFADDDKVDWTYIGTPLYGPPEIVQAWEVDPNKTEISAKDERHSIDIYCAGMVFFEMLFGRLPFAHPTVSDYMQKKSRMISWPTGVVIGQNTKTLIRQLLHYRAWFRPKCEELKTIEFFGGLDDGPARWDSVAKRLFVAPEIYGSEASWAQYTLPLPLQAEVPGVSISEIDRLMVGGPEVEPRGCMPPDDLAELIVKFEAGELA